MYPFLNRQYFGIQHLALNWIWPTYWIQFLVATMMNSVWFRGLVTALVAKTWNMWKVTFATLCTNFEQDIVRARILGCFLLLRPCSKRCTNSRIGARLTHICRKHDGYVECVSHFCQMTWNGHEYFLNGCLSMFSLSRPVRFFIHFILL